MKLHKVSTSTSVLKISIVLHPQSWLATPNPKSFHWLIKSSVISSIQFINHATKFFFPYGLLTSSDDPILFIHILLNSTIKKMQSVHSGLHKVIMSISCGILRTIRTWSWGEGLFDRELEEWANLSSILECSRPSVNHDSLVWNLESGGVFSVKLVYLALQENRRLLGKEIC